MNLHTETSISLKIIYFSGKFYTMLAAQNIKKSFGDLQVLKSINLEIASGKVVSIVGASGAGKSTLLHILGTLDKPDSGKITIDEYDLTNLKSNELARFRNNKIGFIFQFHNLLPEFTALENVCIPAWFNPDNNEKYINQRATYLLERLGLADRKDHKPSELSGGELQRTAVARALINEPAIIFADEPSGNLDAKTAARLHDLFFELRDELGQTFVIVTHNEKLADMADRKMEISEGYIY